MGFILGTILFLKNKLSPKFTEENFIKTLPLIKLTFGIDITKKIEQIYRLETANFKSTQFLKTGTGGMESFGKQPFYGWNKAFFNKYPKYKIVGTYTTPENKTGIKKTFLIWNNIEAAMFYMADYLTKYPAARWFSTNTNEQGKYTAVLNTITPKHANKIV